MKAGIYLGPPIARSRRLGWVLFVVGALGTFFHFFRYLEERDAVRAARGVVERREASRTASAFEAFGEQERRTLTRLQAASLAGVTDTIPMTDLLQAVAAALPERTALAGLSYEPLASPPSLLVEAVARRESDVSMLQRRIAESPLVLTTTLLGERTTPDGTISVRLQVELTPDGRR